MYVLYVHTHILYISKSMYLNDKLHMYDSIYICKGGGRVFSMNGF